MSGADSPEGAAAGTVPRNDIPSASSSRITVASVKDRRPASAFSSVEMLIRARSGERLGERFAARASSSRTLWAISPACSLVQPLALQHHAHPLARSVPIRTYPHAPAIASRLTRLLAVRGSTIRTMIVAVRTGLPLIAQARIERSRQDARPDPLVFPPPRFRLRSIPRNPAPGRRRTAPPQARENEHAHHRSINSTGTRV